MKVSIPSSTDNETFAQLVRERRNALGLSQEALAAASLGNPDRKSFVSALENNRLSKITPKTAQKLCTSLGLSREDIPASLRWPSVADPPPTEERLRALEAHYKAPAPEIGDQAIARFFNAQMANVLSRPMSDIYRERLVAGLDSLRVWMGRPFSLQSLLVCYALSLLYVVTAGLVSFLQGDIAIGNVRFFRAHDWATDALRLVFPYLGLGILVLAVVASWVLVRPLGTRLLSNRQSALRLGGVALIAGLACGIVDYMGIASVTAAALFTVPSVAAISTLPPRRATAYGATGGIAFGLMAAVSSGFSDATTLAFLKSLSEGFIVGGIVGSCAGCASSLIARRMTHLRAGQLAAAGGGVGFGSLVSLAGILAAINYAAVSGGTLGLFAVSWLALPLTNAALDYVSLGVSHGLGRYIIKSGKRWTSILFVFLLDIAIAVALMLCTVAVIGLALGGIEMAFGVETRPDTFLQQSAGDPWGEGVWLTVMVLSTTVWTWLHIAFVVAPLIAGALTRRMLEKPATERLSLAQQGDGFDVSVGVMVVFRFVVFYLAWGAIALFPLLLLALNPEIMETILRLGWQLTAF